MRQNKKIERVFDSIKNKSALNEIAQKGACFTWIKGKEGNIKAWCSLLARKPCRNRNNSLSSLFRRMIQLLQCEIPVHFGKQHNNHR
jgi:hypothetical protein